MTLKTNIERVFQFVTVCMYIAHASTEGIECYKCYVSPPGLKETNQLCSQFDGSSRFQVYCPASTLCMKKTIHYKTKNSLTTTVQRDCAPQRYAFRSYSEADNAWYDQEEIVKTAYDEGCFIGEDRGAPGGPAEYCYCSFHLCNVSPAVKTLNMSNICMLISAVIVIRSLQHFLLRLP